MNFPYDYYILGFLLLLLFIITIAAQSYNMYSYVQSTYACNHIRELQTEPISTSATLPPASTCIGSSSPESPRPPPGPTSKVQDDQDKLHPHLLNHHRRLTILTIPNQTTFSSSPLHPSRPLSLPPHTHTQPSCGDSSLHLSTSRTTPLCATQEFRACTNSKFCGHRVIKGRVSNAQ